MNSVGVFISVATLWFLITLFTRSTSSSQSLTETWIVVIGMLIIGMLTKWLLADLLGQGTYT